MDLFRHQYQYLDEECYIYRYLARSFTHTASDLPGSFIYNPMKQRQMTLRTKLLGLIATALVWLAFWSRANNAVSDELPPEHSPEPVIGKPNEKLKATDAIWEFFKSHRK